MATAERTVRTPGAPKTPAPKTEDAAQPAQSAQADAGLPNAIDIDAKTISAPVLTKQGWVCPVDKPNPNAPR